jgi:inosose dehydratase
MPRSIKIGLNPLPWVLTPAGFDLSIPVLRTAFGEIATTPFRAIQADPPAGLNAAEYRQLLAEFGLEPAPGYFSASFQTETAGDIVEAAKRHAALQADLGNTEVFIAASLTPERMAHPAVGADASEATLRRVIDGLGAAAAPSPPKESPRRCILMSAAPSKPSPRCTRFSTPSRRLTCHSGQILATWRGPA